MRVILQCVVWVAVVVGLTGCGQMGPLYLPAQSQTVQQASASTGT